MRGSNCRSMITSSEKSKRPLRCLTKGIMKPPPLLRIFTKLGNEVGFMSVCGKKGEGKFVLLLFLKQAESQSTDVCMTGLLRPTVHNSSLV